MLKSTCPRTLARSASYLHQRLAVAAAGRSRLDPGHLSCRARIVAQGHGTACLFAKGPGSDPTPDTWLLYSAGGPA